MLTPPSSFAVLSTTAPTFPDAALLPIDPVLPLQRPQLFLLSLQRRPLRVLGHVEVEDDQVAAADVEAGEVVRGVFGVKDVLEDDEGCPSRGLRVPQADLADRAVFPEDVVDLLGRDGEGEVADEEDPVLMFFEGEFEREEKRRSTESVRVRSTARGISLSLSLPPFFSAHRFTSGLSFVGRCADAIVGDE